MLERFRIQVGLTLELPVLTCKIKLNKTVGTALLWQVVWSHSYQAGSKVYERGFEGTEVFEFQGNDLISEASPPHYKPVIPAFLLCRITRVDRLNMCKAWCRINCSFMLLFSWNNYNLCNWLTKWPKAGLLRLGIGGLWSSTNIFLGDWWVLKFDQRS